MGRYLVGERYLSLLLRNQGKGQRRCGIKQGKEDHRDTGDDHLIMGVPGLVQHLQRALLAVLQVLEADIAQGRTPLLQDEEETIRFHQIECMKTIQDPQEVLHKIVAVITIPDHILQDMKMLVEMAMARSLHTNLRKHHGLHRGHRRLLEHQGHPLGPGLGRQTHHLGVAVKSSR